MVTEAKIEPEFNLLLNYLFSKLRKLCVVVTQVKSTRRSPNYIIKLYILNGGTLLSAQMTLCCGEAPTVRWTVKESRVQSSKAETARASFQSLNNPSIFCVICLCNGEHYHCIIIHDFLFTAFRCEVLSVESFSLQVSGVYHLTVRGERSVL